MFIFEYVPFVLSTEMNSSFHSDFNVFYNDRLWIIHSVIARMQFKRRKWAPFLSSQIKITAHENNDTFCLSIDLS